MTTSADDSPVPDTTEAPAPAPFPWPPGEAESGIDALADTWRTVVFRPAAFFAAMPESLSLGAALLYYLVVGVVGAAIRLFWKLLLPLPADSRLSGLLGAARGSTPLVDFLASPLSLLLSLVLAAGVTHLLILALVPRHRPFGTTLRVFCFAYSPVLFAVVPYAGSLAAFLWMTVLSIVGVKSAHGASGVRAAVAVLLPLALALLFIALAFALLARADLLLG